MIRTITTTLIVSVLLIAALTHAQSADTDGEKTLDIRSVGKLSFNIKTGELEKMEDGADLTIESENPEDNLDVKAQTVDFEYIDGENSPSKLILTGSVVISNATMRIEAPKAILNTKSNKAEFIGTSKIFSEDQSPIQADNIEVDLDTGDAVMLKVKSIKED